MTVYENGQIPLSLLVKVPGQENDDAYLSPATCGRWLALKAYVLETWGVTIWIVPGFNAYRPLANQHNAKNAAIAEGRPQDAAEPGTSSHGGVYIQWGSPRDGQESLAIDVGGYEVLNRADWYAACRLFGFEPGFFDWEPWHIIDWNPRIGMSYADLENMEDWDEMATKAEVKQALAEVLFEQRHGPGGRNVWDMLRFIADLAASAPARVWEQDLTAQDEAGKPIVKGGEPVKFKAWGFLTSVSSWVNTQRDKASKG